MKRTPKSGATRCAGLRERETQMSRASTKKSSAKLGVTSSGRKSARGGQPRSVAHDVTAPASNSERKNAGRKPAAKGQTTTETQASVALRASIPVKLGAARQIDRETQTVSASGEKRVRKGAGLGQATNETQLSRASATTIPARAGAARQCQPETHLTTASGKKDAGHAQPENHAGVARISRASNGAAPVPASKRGRSASVTLSPNKMLPSAKPAARKAAGVDRVISVSQNRAVDPVKSRRKAGASGQASADTHRQLAGRKKSSRRAVDRGHFNGETHIAAAPVIPIPRKRGARGQGTFDTHRRNAARENSGSDAGGGGQRRDDAQVAFAPAGLDDLCNRVRVLHRDHKGLQMAVGDMERRIKSEERWCAARRVIVAGGAIEGRKFPPVEDEDRYLSAELHPRYLGARDGLDKLRKEAAAELIKAASRLPVAEWVKSIPGCGIGQLAIVVGECGNLSRFPTVSKLWKYAGLAVIGGRAQRRVQKGDKDGVAEQLYSPKRRSSMYQVSISFGMGKGPYGALIRERKAYEIKTQTALGKQIVPQAVITAAKARKKDVSMMMAEGHIAKRARRYAEKRFLRDLWVAWREASDIMKPRSPVPLAEFPMAAE